MMVQPGVTTATPATLRDISEEARRAELPVFEITTGQGSGRAAFFDAVRAVLPQDPPLLGTVSWDALSDSIWEGIHNIESSIVVILWPDASDYREGNSSDYDMAVS